jgi:predicted nucleic acid-binding protein
VIVLDASAALNLLLGDVRAPLVDARVRGQHIHAPHLIDIEIAHVLRKHALLEEVAVTRIQDALAAWLQLDVQRHPHKPFMNRIWQLRPAMTSYDAAYVALAESLRAPLITTDAKLARSHGHTAKIELLRS